MGDILKNLLKFLCILSGIYLIYYDISKIDTALNSSYPPEIISSYFLPVGLIFGLFVLCDFFFKKLKKPLLVVLAVITGIHLCLKTADIVLNIIANTVINSTAIFNMITFIAQLFLLVSVFLFCFTDKKQIFKIFCVISYLISVAVFAANFVYYFKNTSLKLSCLFNPKSQCFFITNIIIILICYLFIFVYKLYIENPEREFDIKINKKAKKA